MHAVLDLPIGLGGRRSVPQNIQINEYRHGICFRMSCVFVSSIYFDFHSARIIFDVSSGFYLWNVNRTTT